jgi:uncharacterized heparinase superfamily protein
MNRLLWYKNRLAAMSGGEIVFRLREAARRKLDVAGATRLIAPLRDYGELPRLPGLRDGIEKWDIPASLLAQWEADARQAQAGSFTMLGLDWPPISYRDLWHLDPVSGQLWPRDQFCFAIDYRQAKNYGDVKYVWEINRLQHLQPIAALACKRKDKILATFCLNEIENWIDQNAPFMGVNWNSGIELALRVISILTVTTLVGEHLTREQRGKIWSALHTHGCWIARYPSRFSSANNHRTAEGLGLFALGALCPHFAEARDWQKTGWDILCDGAERQILPDGTGAEQAIGYAAATLETLLTGLKIAAAAGVAVPPNYPRKLALGGEYLRWLTDARGDMPHIGDDDNACVFGLYHADDLYAAGILGCIAAVTGRADLTPPHLQPHLRQTIFGFAPPADFAPYGARCFAHGGMTIGRHQTVNGDVMLAFDHGPLGYLSIAAHGHADALSVWLHIDGQPVFVDAGTYLYHADPAERRYFRGTAAHNTLCIGNSDSSIQAGNFNWSRKAQISLSHFRPQGDFWQAEAEHDGYMQNFGVTHRRTLNVAVASGAVIEDQLIGTAAPHAAIHFLLHPDLTARREGSEILILKNERLMLRLRHEGLQTEIARGFYSPRFGIKQSAQLLTFKGMLGPGQIARTHLYWAS